MPAIWASFRNEMIDNAMILNFLQPESCRETDERMVIGDRIAFVPAETQPGTVAKFGNEDLLG
jgi:hypothetical protein